MHACKKARKKLVLMHTSLICWLMQQWPPRQYRDVCQHRAVAVPLLGLRVALRRSPSFSANSCRISLGFANVWRGWRLEAFIARPQHVLLLDANYEILMPQSKHQKQLMEADMASIKTLFELAYPAVFLYQLQPAVSELLHSSLVLSHSRSLQHVIIFYYTNLSSPAIALMPSVGHEQWGFAMYHNMFPCNAVLFL